MSNKSEINNRSAIYKKKNNKLFDKKNEGEVETSFQI